MIRVHSANPKGIVWLASYPKSGNTWMRIYLYHLQRIMLGIPRADNDLNHLDRSSAYEASLYGLFEQLMGKPLKEASRGEVAHVRPEVHNEIAKRTNGVALIKTHNVLGNLEGTPTINLAASAGTVYIIRDPRDLAVSLSAHLGSTIDQAITTLNTSGFETPNREEQAFEIWGSWSEHVLGWTMIPHEAVIVIRYEDLVADPIKHFTAVTEHLGQKPTPGQIDEAVSLSTFKELRDQEEKRGFREVSERADRFFREGRVGEWREKLTSAQEQRIIDAHREQMSRFGYLAN